MLDSRRRIVLATSCAVAILFMLPWPGVATRWCGDLDALFLSLVMQRRAPVPPEDIVGVRIDEASLDLLGRFPWKRSVHAALIERLTALRASVIVFDIYFVRPTEPAEDKALAAAMRKSGRVVVAGGRRGELGAASLFADDARVGQIAVVREDGGMVYRVQPLAADGEAGLPVPALSLAAVQQFRYPDALPVVEPERLRLGDLQVPLEDGRMIIDFSGPPGTLRTVSYADVLQEKVADTDLRGKIAIVFSAFDPNDRFETPADRHALMRGGEVHANAMQTMLSGRFIRRVDATARAAVMLLAALFVAVAMGSSKPRVYLPALVAGIAAMAGLSWVALERFLVWAPVARMALFIPVAAAAILAVERKRAGRVLASFVPEREAASLLDSDRPLDSGSRRLEVSVLFADIRGYTTLSETVEPQRMVAFLNEFHAVTDAAVRARGGEVLDYLGDASMVVFGAPDPMPDHARCAIEAALDMQTRLAGKRAEWAGLGYPPVEVGIGICTGPVAYGLVGTGHRQYTAIGDTTNVAARIQGLSAQFDAGVLISESTMRAAGDGFEIRALPLVPLKGKSEPVQVYAVDGRKRTAKEAR